MVAVNLGPYMHLSSLLPKKHRYGHKISVGHVDMLFFEKVRTQYVTYTLIKILFFYSFKLIVESISYFEGKLNEACRVLKCTLDSIKLLGLIIAMLNFFSNIFKFRGKKIILSLLSITNVWLPF